MITDQQHIDQCHITDRRTDGRTTKQL